MGKSSGDAATRAQSETLAACDISAIKSEIMSNQKLAEEFHKSITKNEKNEKYVHLLIFGMLMYRFAINK